MTDAVHYSSNKSDWKTPKWLFDHLDQIFEFDTDACATLENALCPIYYSKKNDFLKADFSDKSVFMNPIYAKPRKACKPGCELQRCEIHGHTSKYIPGTGDFVDHAYSLSAQNNKFVCLLPARLGSGWFDTVWMAEALIFIRGRIKFVGAKSGAPFPSIVAIMGRGLSKMEVLKLSALGKVILL